MYYDLTRGKISHSLILFALPMIAGNLLQQFYNIADTLIVGRVLGSNALAAVGSSYTLMTFLTSIFLGLSMGAGALFSIYQGRKDLSSLKLSILHAFLLILAVTLVLNLAVYAGIEPILTFLRVPDEVRPGMRTYLLIIFAGLIATSVYNFFSCMLRALGNSSVPLIFLAVSAVLNIALDLLFVAVLPFGIAGAALATVLAQYVSAVGILLYVLLRCRMWLPSKKEWRFSHSILKEILNLSSMTCIQQSVMNFGILMVQGLVNSFGPAVMAAFAAAVKIDTFAYLPVQDFGNAYSTFTAQNLRGRKSRADPARHERCFCTERCFFHRHFSACQSVRASADADFRESIRNGGHRDRRTVPAAGRLVLSRHRMAVSAVRVLPRCQTRRDVGCSDRHFAWHACGAGIPFLRHGAWRCRNLDRHSDRLGTG